MEYFTLRSGNIMPVVGFGTFQLWGEDCRNAVKKALQIGYRSIDTAEDYENHSEIARAIEKSGVSRKEVFLTSKVWRLNLGRQDVVRSCEKILSIFKTDYLDLLLIHWPSHSIPLEDTLQGFKKLLNDGKIRDFGVSNFSAELVQEALELDIIDISVNQIRFHPLWNNEKLFDFCFENNIHVTAHTPLAKGAVLKNEILVSLAAQVGRPVSQLVLRWLFQKGMAVIPKSSRVENIRLNMDLFSFSIPDDIVRKLDDFLKTYGAVG